MSAGFSNLPFEGRTTDGLNWVLTKPLFYTTINGTVFRVDEGTTTDGPSIPEQLESLLHRTGPQWLPGVLHDAAYRGTLEFQTLSGTWERILPAKSECDKLFEEALRIQGLPEYKVQLFYRAVDEFGQKAFDADRSKIVVADQK